MVSTSARNAGGPWFDYRSRHDRFLYANSVCLYNFLYRAVLCFHIYMVRAVSSHPHIPMFLNRIYQLHNPDDLANKNTVLTVQGLVHQKGYQTTIPKVIIPQMIITDTLRRIYNQMIFCTSAIDKQGEDNRHD